jgi:hypothetical protein
VVHVVEAEAALDAQPAMVGRAVAAVDADDALVAHVVGELAADAAVGAEGVDAGGRAPPADARERAQRAGRAGLHALAAATQLLSPIGSSKSKTIVRPRPA